MSSWEPLSKTNLNTWSIPMVQERAVSPGLKKALQKERKTRKKGHPGIIVRIHESENQIPVVFNVIALSSCDPDMVYDELMED